MYTKLIIAGVLTSLIIGGAVYVNHLIASNATMEQTIEGLQEDLKQMKDGMKVRNDIVKKNGDIHNGIVTDLRDTIEELRNVKPTPCYVDRIPDAAADILLTLPTETVPSVPDTTTQPDAGNIIPYTPILPDLSGRGGIGSGVQLSTTTMQRRQTIHTRAF